MPSKRELKYMRNKSGNWAFGFLALGFLFLSVACAHKGDSVSKLEGLSEEMTSAQAENQVEEKSAPTEIAQQTEADFAVPSTDSNKDEPAAPVEAQFTVPSSTEADVAKNDSAPSSPVTETQVVVPSATDADVAKNDNALSVPMPETQLTVPSITEADVAKNDNAVSVPVPETQAAMTTQIATDNNTPVTSDMDTEGRKHKKKKRWKKEVNSPTDDQSASLSNMNGAPVQADPDSESRRKKKNRGPRESDAPKSDQSASVSNPAVVAPNAEEPKKELASANVSNLIERNLMWFALAIVGGLIAVFFTVRRNRKSNDTNS